MAKVDPKPTVVIGLSHESTPQGIHILIKRGYKQTIRWQISRLAVTNFDMSSYAGLRNSVEASGI